MTVHIPYREGGDEVEASGIDKVVMKAVKPDGHSSAEPVVSFALLSGGVCKLRPVRGAWDTEAMRAGFEGSGATPSPLAGPRTPGREGEEGVGRGVSVKGTPA